MALPIRKGRLVAFVGIPLFALSLDAFASRPLASPLLRLSGRENIPPRHWLSTKWKTGHSSSPMPLPKHDITGLEPARVFLLAGLTPNPSSSRATAVYGLMLLNLMVFVADKALGYSSFVGRHLYLFHRRWKWWQPLTSCFCHADRFHLCNNLFLLLLFGRSVEDDQGWGGLLLSYVWCGVLSSLVSLVLLPKNTISIGASGAVFGLFAVSTLAKLSWQNLDWRKLVEVAVLGEFVFRQLATEISTAAGGGRAGINHVAHLSGAAAGAILVFGMRAIVAKDEQAEMERGSKPKKKKLTNKMKVDPPEGKKAE